jgi:hypothetical protein
MRLANLANTDVHPIAWVESQEKAGVAARNLYKRAIRALKSAAFVSRPTWTTSRFGRVANDEAGFGRPQI